MKPLLVLLMAAGTAAAQPAGDLATERQRAIQLMNQGQLLPALPLVEDLAAANPDDGTVQGWLAYCLFAKSRMSGKPEETQALRKRAREAVSRAQQLGSQWMLLKDLVAALDDPGDADRPFSTNAEANARMKEGEEAFAKGDNDGALSAYGAALKIDPKLYHAALFAGDVCFRKKDVACAADWFGRAVAIAPQLETAYRYWGDALMAAGKMLEARDKFIESVIAAPGPKSWAGLMNWAKRNNCHLPAPKIDRPKFSDTPQTMTADPKDLEDEKGAGRGAWVSYGVVRAAWRQTLFAKKYPNETEYRHSLEEEVAALDAVADAIDQQKDPHLDPQLANVILLKRDGLLAAWLLLTSGADAGIARDYAAYRDAHHTELRAYFDKYVIQPNPSAETPR